MDLEVCIHAQRSDEESTHTQNPAHLQYSHPLILDVVCGFLCID